MPSPTVALPLATWAATAAWVKYWRVWITPVTAANISTGEIVGMVMWRNRRHAFAPSRQAASYSSPGTLSSPARKMIMMSPTPHRESDTRPGLDQLGSLNQSGPLIPTSLRTLFTGPVAGLSRKTNAIVAATGGASEGRYATVRKNPAPRFTLTIDTATNRPNTIRSGTITTVSQIVLCTAFHTSGSLCRKNV